MQPSAAYACGVAAFAGSLTAHMLPTLAAAKPGQVPLRHSSGGAHAALIRARGGDAALNLVAFDGAARARPADAGSVAFATGEEWDAVVSGHGAARLIQRRDNRLVLHPCGSPPASRLAAMVNAKLC